MMLQLAARSLEVTEPLVMGILNVTPDSFSDGGSALERSAALHRATAMVQQGAKIIDVGGESTRPGATPVAESEELDRVIPIIERIRRELDCVISIDTTKPAVMREACAAGAEIINDVNALRARGAIEIAQQTRAAVVLMHMLGTPQNMQDRPEYRDVVSSVGDFLSERVLACGAAGIERNRLIVDPGFGFGKTLEHNLQLLARLDALQIFKVPLMIGVSRKSMLGESSSAPYPERLPAGLSAAAIAVWLGAKIIRSHDVSATVSAIGFTASLLNRKIATPSLSKTLTATRVPKADPS